MLGESRFLVCPERLACLVIGMTVETGLRVECPLVSDFQLIHGIVVDTCDGVLLSAFPFWCLFGNRGGEGSERQSHEDAVEPYLVGIDGFVPKYLVGNGTGLVLQLFHHQLHGKKVFLLRVFLVHPGHEVSRADVVEVIVEDVEATDVAVGIDHGVGILFAIFQDVLPTIAQIGVEHTLQFDAHHIAPFGLVREIEEV